MQTRDCTFTLLALGLLVQMIPDLLCCVLQEARAVRLAGRRCGRYRVNARPQVSACLATMKAGSCSSSRKFGSCYETR
ncbi:hypothetical protein CBOM_07593 [Ceraceosorus bombacis]|uniref:Secreted protein n=1 Tax=Ceraceosorus bombacis TaxID=401625 RepID=A0A0P1BG50_9BASI|nr:hypothetical protein CBOM_07593 [Ceraceosorus bombacis]